jgi:hypothetical protein
LDAETNRTTSFRFEKNRGKRMTTKASGEGRAAKAPESKVGSQLAPGSFSPSRLWNLAPRSVTGLRWLAYGVLFLVFWISLLRFPEYVYGWGVDQSFEQPLDFFFKHHAQAGVDYIFTYGPLGWLFSTAYDPDLFWHKYIWEVVINAIVALVSVAVLARQPDIFTKVLYALVFFLYLVGDPYGIRDFFFPYLVLSLTLLQFDERLPRVVQVLGLAVVAVLAWVKFSLFILAAGYLSILVAYRVATKRPRAAAIAVGIFSVSLLAAWVAAGQSLHSLPGYFSSSLEISRGYTEAMSFPGDPWRLGLALAMIALNLALIPTLDWSGVPKPRRWAYLAVFSVGLFFQWKHGIVRPDWHTTAFFAYALCLPFLLFMAWGTSGRRRNLRLAVVAGNLLLVTEGSELLGVPAILVPKGQTMTYSAWLDQYCRHLIANYHGLVFPGRLKGSLESRKTREAQIWRSYFPRTDALSRMRPGATVDVIHYEQGLAFLHGFTPRPRPVFQSYAAFGPVLLRANAAFYRSDQAPDYVVVSRLAMDSHFPALEDSQALFEILERYEPVLFENHSILILKKSTLQANGERQQGKDAGHLDIPRSPVAPRPSPLGSREAPDKLLRERVLAFNERLELGDISDTYQTISIRLQPTSWGRFRSFLFRPPEVKIRVTASDAKTVDEIRSCLALAVHPDLALRVFGLEKLRPLASRPPLTYTYRLVPSMAKVEFLLNPLIRDAQDLLLLYAGGATSRVTRLSLEVSERGPASYENRIEVTLKSRSSIVGRKQSLDKIRAMMDKQTSPDDD